MLLDKPQSAAIDVLARLQKSLDEYNQQQTHGDRIDFSFGIVDFDPDSHGNIEALLADGDALMYKCKQQKELTSAVEIS